MSVFTTCNILQTQLTSEVKFHLKPPIDVAIDREIRKQLWCCRIYCCLQQYPK